MSLYDYDSQYVKTWCQLNSFNALNEAYGGVRAYKNEGRSTVNVIGRTNSYNEYIPVSKYYGYHEHKYLIYSSNFNSTQNLRFYASESFWATDVGENYRFFTERNASEDKYIRFYTIGAGVDIEQKDVYLALFDLTAMYGAGNEPTTIGAFLEDWGKLPWYSYNLFDITKC